MHTGFTHLPKINLDELDWEDAAHLYDRGVAEDTGAFNSIVASFPHHAVMALNDDSQDIVVSYDLGTQRATLGVFGVSMHILPVDSSENSPELDQLFGADRWREFLADYERESREDWDNLDEDTRQRYAEHGYK